MSYVPPHKRRGGGSGASGRYDRIASTGGSSSNKSGRNSLRDLAETSSSSSHQKQDESTFCNAFSRICCINLESRPEKWARFRRQQARRIGPKFETKLERFDAIDGKDAMQNSSRIGVDICLEWDSTKNSKWDRHVEPGTRYLTAGEVGCALSHVSLWRQLAESSNNNDEEAMLIFEDDAAFLPNRHSRQRDVNADRFLLAFEQAWQLSPKDSWDILYLGLSDRGERRGIIKSGNSSNNEDGSDRKTNFSAPALSVELYQPTYGFHTHAYALTRAAARRLLDNLPVAGPLDVWLADNKWFGMNVYCAIVANEGWKNTGANLVHQDRTKGSDIEMSGRS